MEEADLIKLKWRQRELKQEAIPTAFNMHSVERFEVTPEMPEHVAEQLLRHFDRDTSGDHIDKALRVFDMMKQLTRDQKEDYPRICKAPPGHHMAVYGTLVSCTWTVAECSAAIRALGLEVPRAPIKMYELLHQQQRAGVQLPAPAASDEKATCTRALTLGGRDIFDTFYIDSVIKDASDDSNAHVTLYVVLSG